MAETKEEMEMQALIAKSAEQIVLRSTVASENFLSALMTSSSAFTPLYVFALGATRSPGATGTIPLWCFIPAMFLVLTALIAIAARFPERCEFDLGNPRQILSVQTARSARMRVWCLFAAIFASIGLISALFFLAFQ